VPTLNAGVVEFEPLGPLRIPMSEVWVPVVWEFFLSSFGAPGLAKSGLLSISGSSSPKLPL